MNNSFYWLVQQSKPSRMNAGRNFTGFPKNGQDRICCIQERKTPATGEPAA